MKCGVLHQIYSKLMGWPLMPTSEPLKERNKDPASDPSLPPLPKGGGAYRPEKMVRTDPSARTLDAFLSNPLKAAAVNGEDLELEPAWTGMPGTHGDAWDAQGQLSSISGNVLEYLGGRFRSISCNLSTHACGLINPCVDGCGWPASDLFSLEPPSSHQDRCPGGEVEAVQVQGWQRPSAETLRRSW